MTCVIPADLELQLAARAATKNTSVEQLVLEAVSWYLSIDRETFDELSDWQEIRDEAADLVEENS